MITKQNKYSPGFKQFFIKTFLFLVLFIIISFVIGQKIVSSSLLYGFGIYIYGGMGYILLFSVIGFVLLYRERLYTFEKFKQRAIDWAFLIISVILIAGFYILEINIDNVAINTVNIILIHALFLAMFAFLILGIFGVGLLHSIIKKFKRELIYFLIFGIIAYSLMYKVWSLWPYLSYAVARAVYFLLQILSDNVSLTPPDILRFEGFGAKIAEACSGIYSIFIFTGLYIFILLIDWKKLNKKKALLLFVPAVLGAFAVNIIRVFLLMVIGAYVSREAALGLYHSYTGMIFFMIYFIIFWFFAYRWLKK